MMYRIMVRLSTGMPIMLVDRLTEDAANRQINRELDRWPQGQFWIERDE
jgi:hypothetical protein